MSIQDQESPSSQSKKTGSIRILVLVGLLSLLVILSSFSPAFYKSIDSSSVIQQALHGLSNQSSVSDFSQLVLVIRWLKIIQLLFPILAFLFIFLILFEKRNNIWEGIKLSGMGLVFPGLFSFIGENIISLFLNSFQGLQDYPSFLGFSGINADIVKMAVMQMGNIFLFYWGLTSFGIITLGLVLILTARVFKR